MAGIKHLIECHCTLKIYDRGEDIQNHIFHKFAVYSKLKKDENKIVEKIAQCNNCGTLHKVFDICKSELVERGKDDSNSIIDVEDIKVQLSEKVVKILERYKVDIATWEQALDVYEEKSWGSNIIVSRQLIDQFYHVKILQLYENDKIKILSEKIKDEISLS